MLEAVVELIPPPQGRDDGPLAALIFDSWFDAYRGVITYMRVVDGVFRPGMDIRLMATGFANDIDEPYTTAEGKPFSWQGRMRVTCGRTNVWGRHSYRFSQQDLKGYSFDGAGADWPLDYKDLVPYYELVEQYVGISGMVEKNPELQGVKDKAGELFKGFGK